MRARGFAVVALSVVACGGPSKPAPAPLAHHTEPPPPPPVADQNGGDGYGGQAYGGASYGGAGDGDAQIGDGDGDDGMPAGPSCDEIAASPSLLAPVSDLTGEDLAWSTALRHDLIHTACTADSWSSDTIGCFVKANSSSDVADCVFTIEQPHRDEFVKKVVALEDVAKQTAKLRKSPAKISCTTVAAAYYADAKWKDQPAGAKPAERKKALATSRTTMSKACTDRSWSPAMRACLVAGGDECFAAAGVAQTRWTLPPIEVKSFGIAECDDYAVETMKIVGCEKLPANAREAIKQSFDESAKQFENIPADRHQAVVDACRAATEAMHQAGKQIGC